MRQIYVFTAGEVSARQHLNDSIVNAVPALWLDEALSAEQAQYLRSLLPQPDGFYAWGAVPGLRNKPTWESMQVGDVVLTVYDNQYRFVSSVVAKLHQPDLARRIWGQDDQGQTWEYMYLLSRPEPVQVPVTSSPVADHLNQAYRGFTRISEQRVAGIVAAYGDLDAFLASVFGSAPPATVVDRELEVAEQVADQGPGFDPDNLVDGRKKVLAEVVRRQGQPKFRKALLDAYGGRCAVTGCDVPTVLEAAHILAYAGQETNHVCNGLLLRADIHTLFDLGHLKVDAKGVIHLHESLSGTVYQELAGKKIRLPMDAAKAPHPEALAQKYSLVL